MASIPYFVESVDAIRDVITNDGIASFCIDPNWNRCNDGPNVQATFVMNSGKTYIVRGFYNPTTNEFNPPVEKPQPEPIPELLKWRSMECIFEDTTAYLPPIPEGYSDREIDGQVEVAYFDPIFEELDQFQGRDYTFDLERLQSCVGKKCALIREWSTEGSQLQFYITNEDFAIAFGTATTFLIVGNNHSHPFVRTPRFTFDNSDGSTDIDVTLFPEFTLAQVKQLLKEKAIEYIFDQGH